LTLDFFSRYNAIVGEENEESMIKLLTIAALLSTGCALTVEEEYNPPRRRTTVSSHVVYSYDGCSPRDFDYGQTDIDCPDSHHLVEVCDPDRVFRRPGCWTLAEVRWSFGDCIIDHQCW